MKAEAAPISPASPVPSVPKEVQCSPNVPNQARMQSDLVQQHGLSAAGTAMMTGSGAQPQAVFPLTHSPAVPPSNPEYISDDPMAQWVAATQLSSGTKQAPPYVGDSAPLGAGSVAGGARGANTQLQVRFRRCSKGVLVPLTYSVWAGFH